MTEEKRSPSIGDLVEFTALMIKVPNQLDRGHHWERYAIPSAPRSGIFIGWRLKQNGRWLLVNDSAGDPAFSKPGYEWHEDSRTKVALVAVDPWHEPLIVDQSSMVTCPPVTVVMTKVQMPSDKELADAVKRVMNSESRARQLPALR